MRVVVLRRGGGVSRVTRREGAALPGTMWLHATVTWRYHLGIGAHTRALLVQICSMCRILHVAVGTRRWGSLWVAANRRVVATAGRHGAGVLRVWGVYWAGL